MNSESNEDQPITDEGTPADRSQIPGIGNDDVETDAPRYTAIFDAIQNGDAAKAESLIDINETLLNAADHNQSTPLTRAFAHGHVDLALSLIKRGANPFAMNHSDKWGMRYIVEKDGLNDEQRLPFIDAIALVRGTEPRPGPGIASVFYAVWERDAKAVAAIVANEPNQTSVYHAAPDGQDGFYNGLPYCGLTPLHYAVIAGDEATVKVLLEAGAEVDAVAYAHKSASRHTPMYFVPEGCEAIAELLIKHGANPKHSTLYLTEGSKSMRTVVVAHGAGETPLLRALITKDFDRAAEIIREDKSVIDDRLPNAKYNTPAAHGCEGRQHDNCRTAA